MSAVPKFPARPMSFLTEDEAQAYIHDALRPFCAVTPEPPLRVAAGIKKPDFGIRLNALPAIPLCIEAKQFSEGHFSPLAQAVAQGSYYASLIGTKCFVAPLRAAGPARFHWRDSPVGAALLVAAEFNVGGLWFAEGQEKYGKVGGLFLGGVAVATFSFNGWGDPETQLHSNAAHLLKGKLREGSQAWRPS